VKIAVYLAAVGVVIVGLDRAFAVALFAHPTQYVPEYRSSYHPTVGVKVRQLEHLGNKVDILLLGNSLTMMGVDPVEYDRTLGVDRKGLFAYNAAVPSVGVSFWPRFVDSYFGRSRLKLVLLGVQPRDFDGEGAALTAPLERQFYASGAYRIRSDSRLRRAADEAVERALILWGRRGDLFNGLGSIVHGTRYDPNDILIVNRLGWGNAAPKFLQSRAELTSGRASDLKRRAGPVFSFAPEEKAALARLARWSADHGAKLVLFSLPEYYDSEAEGAPKTRQTFVTALRSLVAHTPNTVFLDFRTKLASSYTWRDYADEDHLNASGAQRFSATLARATRAYLP
jgi:hypothetical protein